jgi:enediyne biosynthesis protein E4
VAALVVAGCSADEPKTPAPARESPPRAIVFTEITDDRVPVLEQTAFIERNDFFGPGVAIGDVNGDGRPDVYFAGHGLYLNLPDSRGFRLEAAPAALPVLDLSPIGAAFGDVDRDGDLDLALSGDGGVRLLSNDGTGVFHDVTDAAGVRGGATDVSAVVAFGDLDGDGWLDLAVGNYGLGPVLDKDGPMFREDDSQRSHLHLNRRDGTFAELSSPLDQPELVARAMVAMFADVDGDGALDLYVGDDGQIPLRDRQERHDLVLLNHGLDGTGALSLVESSDAFGLATARATMGCALGNPSRGAGWDLFFSDIQAGWLFRRDLPGARFREVGRDAKIDLAGSSVERWVMWGSAFADLDGDGREDLLVSQAPIHDDEPGADEMGPALLRSRADGTFELTRYAFGGPLRARAMALVDLDGDGDQDVITAPFFDRFRVLLNETETRGFLRISLRSTVSAPFPAGAIVTAKSGDAVQKRMLVAGGQPHSQSEDVIDLAVAPGSSAEVSVVWPSGAKQTVPSVSAGSAITIEEPAWLTLTDSRPTVGGAPVMVTVNAAAAGLGGSGTVVTLSGAGEPRMAICDGTGVASFELPAPATAGELRLSLSVGGVPMPFHPAVDYR